MTTEYITLDVANALNGFKFEPEYLNEITDGGWMKLHGNETAESVTKHKAFDNIHKVQRLGMVTPVTGKIHRLMEVCPKKLSDAIGSTCVREFLRNDLATLYDERDRIFLLRWPFTKPSVKSYLEFSLHRRHHTWTASVPDYSTYGMAMKAVYTNGEDFSVPGLISPCVLDRKLSENFDMSLFSKPVDDIKKFLSESYLQELKL